MPQIVSQRVPSDMNPLQLTEWLMRQPKPFTGGLIVNRPAGGMSHAARLFQARMWRSYAMDWDLPERHLRRRWVEQVGRTSRAKCLRLARINLYLAARLRRTNI